MLIPIAILMTSLTLTAAAVVGTLISAIIEGPAVVQAVAAPETRIAAVNDMPTRVANRAPENTTFNFSDSVTLSC